METYAAFTATQTYTYDSLNCLKSATEMLSGQTAANWKQTFKYDRYGNRNFDYGTNPSVPETTTPNAQSTLPKVVNPEVLTTNNRFKQDQDNDGIADYLYDAGGNTTKDALGRTFIYNAENKQTEVIENSATIGRYFYDGDGKRVKKMSATETVIFIYDAAGKLVAEYANQIAQPTEAQVSYLTSDHLGSPRVNTNANGAIISRHDYQPFGEEIQRASYATDAVRKQFTGYERDIETNLDFAEARMYGYSHGRFTSPDPLMASASTGNPQTWNRYIYVGNNPLNIIDPTGLSWYSRQGENGSTSYGWYDSDPGEGWNRVENFTYDAGAGHGFVALDPYSANWTEGHANQQVAFNTISSSVALWNTNQLLTGINDTLSPTGHFVRNQFAASFGFDDNINERSTPYVGGRWTGAVLEFAAGTLAGGLAGAGGAVEGAAAESIQSQRLLNGIVNKPLTEAENAAFREIGGQVGDITKGIGTATRESLTESQRILAARKYLNSAFNPLGNRPAQGVTNFQIDRANFMLNGGTPPGTLTEYLLRNGY